MFDRLFSNILTIKVTNISQITTIMFAIIAVGDGQYKIVVGEACVFEKIDKQEDEDITMSGLLLLSNAITAKVFCEITIFI